jgi:serine/threonine-protein kinase
MTDPTPEISEGKKFGRYSILELLATGGMARIFKARTGHEKILTLKKILPEYSTNQDFIRMFLEEAKISLQLKHPHVVRVLDFGQIETNYYLAMEYVFGRDLGSMLRICAETRVYIPVDVACLIILQCCRGLDYAHSMTDSFGKPLGLVHRDISPPNILISYNGEAKILDFGIAKAVRASGRRNTRSGVLKGKFSYMSPEQASGEALDHQSDLFSLGIVFHELLTSRSLFYSDDEIETLERVRKAKVEPPSRFRKDLPKELDRIVLKALALKKRNRFSTCLEFADAIRTFLKAEYPRSDARNVARFVRSCFYEDYQKRIKVTLAEGWKDTLAVGAADDEIMLDRTFSEQDSLMTRKHEEEISWFQRLIYDPITRDRFRRHFATVFGGIVIVAALSFSVFTGKATLFLDAFQKAIHSPSATSESVTPSSPQVAPAMAPEGSFSDWVQKGQAAEEQDPNEALKYYLQALSINPFEQSVLIRKNFMLLAIGEFDEACRWFHAKQDLGMADRLLSDAACSEIQGETQRAMDSYSNFLEKFSADTRAKNVRGLFEILKDRVP